MSSDRLIGELERVIEKEKPMKNLMSEDKIIFVLAKILQTLDNEDFEQNQKIKQQQDDEINDEIDLNRLKDEIDAGEILGKCQKGGQNYNFFCHVFEAQAV